MRSFCFIKRGRVKVGIWGIWEWKSEGSRKEKKWEGDFLWNLY